MFYRVRNRTRGPIQLATKRRDGNGTQVMALPRGKEVTLDEEVYSDQISNLEARGLVTVEQIHKK